jgi:hypothetical protein
MFLLVEERESNSPQSLPERTVFGRKAREEAAW